MPAAHQRGDGDADDERQEDPPGNRAPEAAMHHLTRREHRTRRVFFDVKHTQDQDALDLLISYIWETARGKKRLSSVSVIFDLSLVVVFMSFHSNLGPTCYPLLRPLSSCGCGWYKTHMNRDGLV